MQLSSLIPVHNCKLSFLKELFAIESPGSQITEEDLEEHPDMKMDLRKNLAQCYYCKDDPNKKCKHCGCYVCKLKKDSHLTLICDECDDPFHLYCLDPPLQEIPSGEWFCPYCKNDDTSIVRPGEAPKFSPKKASLPSATTSRKWGGGMACVGRSTVCTLVPPNHFGPIPGIEVGTLWKFRVQVSEAGVHRPHVCGIHGRENEGAYSLVLSGGYEENIDYGEEIFYSGIGGRDLSGNKRTAKQSCDQTLTRMNKALAVNCNAPLNTACGNVATDWKGGKPVRVVRNYKGRSRSSYGPLDGNRYDGIYKVVMYWPELGKSGFIIWRFLLRRDDEAPAPWTYDGRKRAPYLPMKYPDGYEEKEVEDDNKEDDEEDDFLSSKGKGIGKKRKLDLDSPSIHTRPERFVLSLPLRNLITEDFLNKKLWDQPLAPSHKGFKVFMNRVQELFCCICCLEVVCQPVSLPCSHNICKMCLERSFKAETFACPMCRFQLDSDMVMKVNMKLCEVLRALFPGYEAGR